MTLSGVAKCVDFVYLLVVSTLSVCGFSARLLFHVKHISLLDARRLWFVFRRAYFVLRISSLVPSTPFEFCPPDVWRIILFFDLPERYPLYAHGLWFVCRISFLLFHISSANTFWRTIR